MAIEAVLTGEALEIAGLDRQAWRSAINAGHYRAAPAPVGNTRLWDVAQVTCLRFFRNMVASGAHKAHAGSLAFQLAVAMEQDPDAALFGVFAVPRENGQIEVVVRRDAPAGAHLIFTLPIGEYRAATAEAMRTYRSKAGNA